MSKYDDGGVIKAQVEGHRLLCRCVVSSFSVLHRGHGIHSLPGCDLILDLAAGAFFKDSMFERFGVVQALGGVEDFDGGEGVGGVVVESDGGLEVVP